MRAALSAWSLAAAAIAMGALCTGSASGASPNATPTAQQFYLPDAAASKVVSVTTAGQPAAEVTILTESVAIKETGPKETVKRFGEVYAFSPEFIAVHRDEPTQLTFWNLQPDDEHDFMLAAPDSRVLMHVKLPPLTKMSWVFTFHQEGLFPFYCAVHQPAMSGQILVLPERKSGG
jgi:plastocyanin